MSDERTETILSRLARLHPRKIDLSLGRIQALLDRLGNPERRTPPVVHVAGTNGKGSTIAFLRAFLESGGARVHVYTSPHLVSFRERIRLAGRLIDEDRLAAVLGRCERAQAGEPITLFEITTAAAFVAFAEEPADALLLEVGLGGRYDATNVVERPAACVIAPVSLDHQEFLGSTLAEIAGEKAGVIKRGSPLVVARQPAEALRPIERAALRAQVPIILEGRDFSARIEHGRFVYEDEGGLLDLQPPRLVGRHQVENAAVAIATLRAAFPSLPFAAFDEGMAHARWPARMQRLSKGPLAAAAPGDSELWLDGAHNEAGARTAAEAIADLEERAPRSLILVCGMLASKDPAAFLSAFLGLAQEVCAISFRSEGARPAQEVAAAASKLGFRAAAFDRLEDALADLKSRRWRAPPRILICGSLYLAGEALAASGCAPA